MADASDVRLVGGSGEAPRIAPHRFLNQDLTRERAEALVAELGFLGICDLVHVWAEKTDGGIACEGDRVIVKVRTLRSALQVRKRRLAKERKPG